MVRPSQFRSIALLVGLAFAATSVFAGAADAKRKKRKKRKRAKVAKVNAKALAELMGPFKFGMSKNQVLGVLNKQLKERYAEQIKNTTDIYKQDALRRKRASEYKRIAKTYETFSGKKTGWDVSIIDDQFMHNTDESMLVYWENVGGKDQRRFFFFHEGRLWRMFIALSSTMLREDQRNFKHLKAVMTARFGGATVHKKARAADYLQWKTRNHIVRAFDKLDFYGVFALSISAPAQERAILAIREAAKKPKKGNAITDAVIEKDGDTPDLNENTGAVDAVLGN